MQNVLLVGNNRFLRCNLLTLALMAQLFLDKETQNRVVYFQLNPPNFGRIIPERHSLRPDLILRLNGQGQVMAVILRFALKLWRRRSRMIWLVLFLGMCAIDWPHSLWGKLIILLLLANSSQETISDGLITFGRVLITLIGAIVILIIIALGLDIVGRMF